MPKKKPKPSDHVESAGEMLAKVARASAKYHEYDKPVKTPVEPPPGTPLSKAMTPTQIGAKMGIHPDTVVSLIESGKLPAYKLSDRAYQIPLDRLPPEGPKSPKSE